MTKQLAAFCALLTAVTPSSGQTNQSLPLWPDGAPGALGKEAKDIPTLTPFLPDPAKLTGAAIVICPGGGYGGLADHEGSQYARWLNEQGIAGFVLKYRLGSAGYRHPIMLQDAPRAGRPLRAPPQRGATRRQTDRPDGFFRGRPPRLDLAHALRRGQTGRARSGRARQFT